MTSFRLRAPPPPGPDTKTSLVPSGASQLWLLLKYATIYNVGYNYHYKSTYPVAPETKASLVPSGASELRPMTTARLSLQYSTCAGRLGGGWAEVGEGGYVAVAVLVG